MRSTKRLLLSAVTGLTCLPSVVGCEKPPRTTVADILDYVRNADAGAEVRRLDPDAQDYVQAVLKAYGGWRKAWAPVDDISDLDVLWGKESNEWRDAGKVAKRRADAFQRVPQGSPQGDEPNGRAAAEKKKQPDQRRAERYDALLKAIDNVPEAFQKDRVELIRGIRSRLASRFGGLEDAVARYIRVAKAYQELLSLAADHKDAFDPKRTGLAFTNAETTANAMTLWSQLHTLFERERSAELAEIESLLTEGKKTRDRDIEEKRSLRRGSGSDMRRLRELELTIRYYDAKIKWAQKRKDELAKHAKATGS